MTPASVRTVTVARQAAHGQSPTSQEIASPLVQGPRSDEALTTFPSPSMSSSSTTVLAGAGPAFVTVVVVVMMSFADTSSWPCVWTSRSA